MRPLFLFLAAIPLAAQVVVIDAGGTGDVGYSSATGYPTTAYTLPNPIPLPVLPPGTTDTTMRYGQSFAYDIPLARPGWWTVLLQFVEPCTGPGGCGGWVSGQAGQRVFSVWANDQPIVQDLDLVGAVGQMVPTARSALVAISSTNLHLAFLASVRNAVISAITVSYSPAISIMPYVPDPGPLFVDGEIPAGAFDGVNTSYTLAFAPFPPTSLHFYRNWSRMTSSAATWQLSGNTLTVTTPLQPTESMIVDYRH